MSTEFTDIFGEWLQNGVTIETRTGNSSYGEVYADPVACPDAMVEETRRIVINSAGNQQVSEARIFVDEPNLAKFTDLSRVTLPSGRVATVIAVSHLDVFGLMDYVAVYTS